MSEFLFFVGLDQPSDARHFDRSFISVNQLRRRHSDFLAQAWIMDSGAFTEISNFGQYRASAEEYAGQIDRWRRIGNFQAAAIQDYMCEPFILRTTGLTVADHQRLTIERFDTLRSLTTAPLLPVLQGYAPDEYASHIEQYGARLRPNEWVGVGSICRRNSKPAVIEQILATIKRKRPDLRLHGFGLKLTALQNPGIRVLLHSSDSMAWSYHLRRTGGGTREQRRQAAQDYAARINSLTQQHQPYTPILL